MAKVFNFGAGPAMLPESVMQQIREEWLDFSGMGVSIIEISHRAKEFEQVLLKAQDDFRKLTNLPENYKILFIHGGARMQFSALPLNLARRSESKKCLYVETGNFAKLANKDAAAFCDVKVIASSADTNYDRIPEITPEMVDQDAAYLHITTNNTIYGSRYNSFPETGAVPLIADQTSEILSRVVDYSKFGCIYAGLQKNLGPSGTAIVVIREDLLGQAAEKTPTLLNYTQADKDNSLTNTANTFAIYTTGLVLQWLLDQGGVAAIEKQNEAKAKVLYDLIDSSDYFRGVILPEFRGTMNVSFNLPTAELEAQFLKEAGAANLYALKGHRSVGGIRASIYNAMPMAGVEALANFMQDFAKKNS
ncbi:phosphoserine aminotransferase apoenzyme [Malonomonas rubra DSM 5091]|uniref:Phosphoserine aminotransferase n=1 Tax=Malonomonas rubra DSM 5091 TaxID=1122189 RepID=A0A1M6L7H0_MALRU|nr:3-phosphoserine/phosphohydroxythreonine transaminase [Malonomonas rubra]SHJ67208.1 phosphoserine aminotransferase apoenzyme [Malonomonas rubra DSM 5091]